MIGRVLMGLIAAVLGIATGAAQAQAYPSQSIKVIVPYGPGQATDVMCRVFVEQLKVVLKRLFRFSYTGVNSAKPMPPSKNQGDCPCAGRQRKAGFTPSCVTTADSRPLGPGVLQCDSATSQ